MLASNYELPYDYVFGEMSAARGIFYLTGSRFFDCARPDSDYDFYTDCDANTLRMLIDLGFATLPRHNYTDGNTLFVLHYDGQVKIDVQIELDVPKKSRAQNLIYRCGQLAHGKLSGDEARYSNVWDEVYSLLD